jgi:hypothetical protein
MEKLNEMIILNLEEVVPKDRIKQELDLITDFEFGMVQDLPRNSMEIALH